MKESVRVKRELYAEYSKERGGAVVSVRYLGNGLRREERLSYERYDDWQEGHQIRTSEDNGETWTEWCMLHEQWPRQHDFDKEEGSFAWCHDPVSNWFVQVVFQRITIGAGNEAIARKWKNGKQTYFDHNFYQTSGDGGRTWGSLEQLRYEDGPAFNPEDWGNERYLRSNQMYGGLSLIAASDGTLIYPSCGIDFSIGDNDARETVRGIRCFIGRWSEDRADYTWEISRPIWVPHRVSGRGLLEPVVTELTDCRLLLMSRGSTAVFPPNWDGTVENGGRKWISLSADGGHTWSPVTDLRYDTGEPFYSPSAFARFLRCSRSGRLFCFLNISPHPTVGNRPRYPLYMAEVDETIPAIRKDSLVVIDDRDPEHDTESVQFSNFSVFEDRETGKIELYLTRYGEREDWRMANAYRYTIELS